MNIITEQKLFVEGLNEASGEYDAQVRERESRFNHFQMGPLTQKPKYVLDGDHVKYLMEGYFNDPRVMLEVQGLINSKILSTANPTHHSERIGEESANGNVDRVSVIGTNARFILKTLQRRSRNEEMIHEAAVGFVINMLRDVCPNFMYTFSIFTNHYTGLMGIIAEEIKNSPSLFQLIESERFTIRDFYITYYHVLRALKMAQQFHGFVHNDLHAGNVLCQEPRPEDRWQFTLEGRKIAVKFLPRIIDFGMSTVKIGEVCFYNTNKRLRKYGTGDYTHGSRDAFRLFATAMHSMRSKRQSLFNEALAFSNEIMLYTNGPSDISFDDFLKGDVASYFVLPPSIDRDIQGYIDITEKYILLTSPALVPMHPLMVRRLAAPSDDLEKLDLQ